MAANWLLARPTVSSVIIGARDERELRDKEGFARLNPPVATG